jgi:hypothetical protein
VDFRASPSLPSLSPQLNLVACLNLLWQEMLDLSPGLLMAFEMGSLSLTAPPCPVLILDNGEDEVDVEGSTRYRGVRWTGFTSDLKWEGVWSELRL